MKLSSEVIWNTQKPTYPDFDTNHMELWPDYFFCYPCSICDDAVSCESSRTKRNSIECKCTSGHASFDIPTTKAKNSVIKFQMIGILEKVTVIVP